MGPELLQSKDPIAPKDKTICSSPASVHKSVAKRGLTKTDLSNPDMRKPLFPSDATQKTASLDVDSSALDDEPSAALSKVTEDLTGNEEVPSATKKAQAVDQVSLGNVPFWFIC